ncbi:hypothetical protein ACELLULO517_15720 [Acidisoma cellulosilytica]|uniref:Uncharacterized protein n=1 Tax=Acidisoma cellulosilyticum TaxID=2802395 RepID=A0A963Z369_9PROT|nr:hypothetical protein [Acidisoma cellulosilyticum]MCB8881696.1 hypothetical protein [Acidisoma cellulosilyticum]
MSDTLSSFGAAQSTDPLTDTEKSDIRFFCGYEMYGNSAAGFLGYRFFQEQGFLEYRLTNAAPSECASIRQMLSEMQTLRTAILGASTMMGTDQAAVWTRNRNEARDRTALYDQWRTQLCRYLGVPAGPGIASAQAGRIIV